MPIRLKACSAPPYGCGESKILTSAFWRDETQPDGRMSRCIDCVQRSRKERQQRRAEGEDVPVVSEELSRMRSDNAKRLHAEGRLGGSRFGKLGGRSRKTRLDETVLEHFRDRTELIVEAYESNLRSRDRTKRLRAANALMEIEREDDSRRRAARGSGKDPHDMDPEELEELIVQGLSAMIDSGEVDMSAITLPDSAVTEMSAEAMS